MLHTLPERKVVFKGLTTDKENMDKLVLTPLVRYPLSGGSALITFEKAEGKSEKSAAVGNCPCHWGLPSITGSSATATALTSTACPGQATTVQGCSPFPKLSLSHVLSY